MTAATALSSFEIEGFCNVESSFSDNLLGSGTVRCQCLKSRCCMLNVIDPLSASLWAGLTKEKDALRDKVRLRCPGGRRH